MKSLHYPIRLFKVTFKNGKTYEANRFCNMSYSEPCDKIEDVYASENINDFIEKYSYCIIIDYTWRFKKYIVFDGYCKKILLNDIESIEVSKKHTHVDRCNTIERIGKELPYDEFMQFIFDKEQELRSVITSMSK